MFIYAWLIISTHICLYGELANPCSRCMIRHICVCVDSGFTPQLYTRFDQNYRDWCDKKKITKHIEPAFNVLQSSFILKPQTLSSFVSTDGSFPRIHFFRERAVALSHFLGFPRCLEISFLSGGLNFCRNSRDLGYMVTINCWTSQGH